MHDDPDACVLSGGGGPRRRPVVLTGRAPAAPSRVLKVAPALDAGRGEREQRMLAALGGDPHIPLPLGQGRAGPFAWTAESAMPGRPLADLLGETASRTRSRQVLTDVAGWLGALGARSRTARSWSAGQGARPLLLGEHAGLKSWLAELDGVPGVMVHGDLASAMNLLVSSTSWAVIDWETSCADGLPLLDLLPLLCGALAAQQRLRDEGARAGYILRLCAGDEIDSPLLLGLVAAYLGRTSVPLAKAGRLAALAFGHQASMRVEHERLVRAAGATPVAWRSMWDEVTRGWRPTPRLGVDWPALVAASGPSVR